MKKILDFVFSYIIDNIKMTTRRRWVKFLLTCYIYDIKHTNARDLFDRFSYLNDYYLPMLAHAVGRCDYEKLKMLGVTKCKNWVKSSDCNLVCECLISEITKGENK